jgi:predicted RND superfamily exporter protein
LGRGPQNRNAGSGLLSRWAAIGLCAALGVALFAFVDLSPKVDEDFFFSSEDPQLQNSLRIEEEFGADRQIFIAARATQLESKSYIAKVLRLSEDLRGVDGVADVRSLTHGPEKPDKVSQRDPAEIFEDLLDSPFWTQLILAPDRSATFIVLRLGEGESGATVRAIDRVLTEHNEPGFELAASGVPYVSEHIRQKLTGDLRRFSIAAFVMFGILVGILFRSLAIVIGTMIAALAASFGTFLVRAALGMQTDILAPNLWTIAFVLTLSHVVYLTAQWRRQAAEVGPEKAVRRSVSLTGPASAWSLAANLLGFASLIFVSAKPLRQFGISGAIAAVLAIACAYVLFPPFLKAADPGSRHSSALAKHLDGFFSSRHSFLAAGAVLIALVLAPFAWRVNSDPSLPSYFAESGAVSAGLRAIDQSAGSSPLDIVIVNASGARLDNDDSFQRLRSLHDSLVDHQDVGSAISIALLMEETDRRWYSFLFSRNQQLKQLEKPEHGRIGDAFISDDHLRGRLILRMHEIDRTRSRDAIVNEIQAEVRKHGFEPELVGGLYLLQGELSSLVESSVIRGLGGLLALFFVIAWIVSRSLWTAAAMAFCLALTPFLLFGAVGLFGMPLDIISAPAANVALPLGIDEMIHLGYRIRRRGERGKDSWSAWRNALQELWGPILASMLIVVSGFSLFLFSSFPPTQRLGILVCAGAALTDLVVLVVLPAIASRAQGVKEHSLFRWARGLERPARGSALRHGLHRGPH